MRHLFCTILLLLLQVESLAGTGSLLFASSVEQSATADIVAVNASGTGPYRFSVQISSPDTGCDQYADWWELLTSDGRLIYRRILAHSHVTENPFTRSSTSPIDIAADEIVYVRGHMNNAGYGGAVWIGNISNGFRLLEGSRQFPPSLETEQPLPLSCAF